MAKIFFCRIFSHFRPTLGHPETYPLAQLTKDPGAKRRTFLYFANPLSLRPLDKVANRAATR